MVAAAFARLPLHGHHHHDHGHDHKPVGRGNEGRRFIGFNFRMMELQGALGLVQLARQKLRRMRRRP